MGKPLYGQKNNKKNTSWMYRKKAKLKKTKVDANDNANGQDSKIIVRNLPFKVTEEDLTSFYKPFGEIKEVNLLKRSDGNPLGCGFILFKHVEDASKAIFNTNKKEFLGRIVSADWAISKSKFCKKLEEGLTGDRELDKDKRQTSCDIEKEDDEVRKKIAKEKDNFKKQKRRKIEKMRKQKKRARIVIRNLSFQITEDNLKEHFSQYGEIDEIKILTRPDGKQTRVAFVQFNIVQSAAKAIHYANRQPLLNRLMVVDWAVAKNKFSQNSTEGKSEIENEPISEDEGHDTLEKKVSHNSEDKISDSDDERNRKEIVVDSIKVENEFDQEEVEVIHEAAVSDDESETTVDNDGDDESDNNINITIDQSVIKEECKNEEKRNFSDVKYPRQISNDVGEGKTIFLKNVPFSVKNDELKTYMEQFGPLCYAVVCIDPLTEYSKGTAFVKFKYVDDMEKCLSTGIELRLRDQGMEAHRALHKKEIQNKKDLKEQRIKDTRNLYLVKEGIVLAKSSAAAEVSVSDMQKRLKLEQWKSQMLRNLNMFISRVRLVVHNLPSDFDDVKLRQLFKNHSGPKAVITEARVMRDLKNIDATGKGKSKEHGFVAFTTHEDALKALRSINNNPNIFFKNRRPIVGFSIENRILVNAKQRRMQKSLENNPLWLGSKNKRKDKDTKEKMPIKRLKIEQLNDSNEIPYAGITGKLGQDKLRSNSKLKLQAELHMRTVKKQNKLNKTKEYLKAVKKEKAKNRQHMPMKRTKKSDIEDANFDKLVDDYRNKLKGINLKRSKWYESSSKT